MTLDIDISHSYRGFALKAAFEVPPGVTALFGRSGSGKTTIINAVAGLIKPDHAEILHNGTVLHSTKSGHFIPTSRRRMGYVFQDARLFPHLSVAQNLDYAARFLRQPPPAKLRSHVVDMLGIGHLLTRHPVHLSGGEKQRVALGRALLSTPNTLLLDEPLAALDDERKREIMPYLETVRDEVGLPILYVSHSVAEVARLATNIIMLDGGTITASGKTSDVFSNPDIWPDMGVREAGSVLSGIILEHAEDGLTKVGLKAGSIHVPGTIGTVGNPVTLRISAHDIIIALEPPAHISAVNILGATIISIRDGDGPGVIVRLNVGGDTVLARITRRSALRLELVPGMHCHVMMKSVAIAPMDVGARHNVF